MSPYNFIPLPKSIFDCSPKENKILLRNITLEVHPGEMAYLMGASGAGKTTLLDVLAGRVRSGKTPVRGPSTYV